MTGLANQPFVEMPFEQIALCLQAEGWQRRRGKDGRPKLRGQCLFHHPDPNPSADFYPDDGWYYCHACNESFSSAEIEQALGLDIETAIPQNATSQPEAGLSHQPASEFVENSAEFHYHTRYGNPEAVYVYRFLDGRISHYKLRFLLPQGKKTFAIQAPNGHWNLPGVTWPIYGDYQLPTGLCYVLVEGEQAQERCVAAAQTYQGVFINALTMGSAASMQSAENRKTLIDRLHELNPARILVWPDNDKSGNEWAGTLYRQLLAEGFQVAKVDIRTLSLDPGKGCDDWIEQGNDLGQMFERCFQHVGGYSVDQVIENIPVTKDGQLVVPSTRQVHPIKPEWIEVAFFRMTQQPTPGPKVVKRIQVELTSKSLDSKLEVFYRRWHNANRSQCAWRLSESALAYHVSADGISYIDDPQNALLFSPPATASFTQRVEEAGVFEDLVELCRLFNVKNEDVYLIECWLLCALCGYQTPILLLRGEAGSFKTTLARILVGILEPTVPEISLSASNQSWQADQRALIGGLRTSMVALIDNVSKLSGESEDLLCRFVTGFGIMHRELYENRVVNLSMQRAIVITTSNWNVQKGDLVSRIVAIRMKASESFRDEVQIDNQVQPLVERIRGYLLRRLYHCYRQAAINPNGSSIIRAAGIGKIFRLCGYDAAKLEARLAFNRGNITSETDSWLTAIVDWYFNLNLKAGDTIEVRLEDIKGSVEGLSGEFIPTDKAFANFINESLPRFRDFGFTLTRHRTNRARLWRVHCLRDINEFDDGVTS